MATSGGRGRAMLPPGDELIAMKDGGATSKQIADKYGSSVSAVDQKIAAYRKKLLGENADKGGRGYLPWEVARSHIENNRIYTAARAYAKQQSGLALEPDEVQQARRLYEHAIRQNLVMLYDRVNGFQWRTRRPDDKDILVSE